jgi:signal transduction histidine kinase
MEQVTVSSLKAFDALKNVPDDELEWLIANCKHYQLNDGDVLSIAGTPLAGPHFLLDGRLRIFLVQNGLKNELATFKAGDITGYLPFSRGVISTANSHAVGQLTLMSFPTERIREMIKDHFEITQALVHVMSNRVREFTALQQQNEKMMALGKLSAGLAHELNNPASAIVRDSVSLMEHLKLEPTTFKNVIAIRMEPEQVDAVNDELFRVLSVKDRPRLTLKQKTQLEDEITDWLDEHGVANCYEIADSFVDFNFSVDDLNGISKHVPPAFNGPVLNWISSVLVTEKMVEDIQESARRIADLVTSVKTFTHMDRGFDKQYADIHIGITNTLKMLGYKLKKGNITLVEDFDRSLPPVKALIGELNQVWTNLIDNALDAMEVNGKGILTIKTEREREFVQVFIIDDGPGIPDDAKPRIFDPFFTTKEMGKGTGMGLEVVQRIVHQHNGSIKVVSEAGRTAFSVCFPING